MSTTDHTLMSSQIRKMYTHKYTSSIEKVHKEYIDSHTDLIRIQNTKNFGKWNTEILFAK